MKTPFVVPYGAVPGFNLGAETREIAAHYAVSARALRQMAGRGPDIVTLARHALFWKLTVKRKLSAGRVAQLLRCSAKAVREGARLHQKRIDEFRAMSLRGAA